MDMGLHAWLIDHKRTYCKVSTLICAACASIVVLDRSNSAAQVQCLEQLVYGGTFVEMMFNIDSLWLRCVQPRRKLPFWEAPPSSWTRGWSRFLFKHAVVHDTAAVLTMFSLLAVGLRLTPELVWLWRCCALTGFLLLGVADMPRFIRLHHCMFLCGAFSTSAPVTMLRLIMGGVYFWSGLAKTINPCFYTSSAVDTPCHTLRKAVDVVFSLLEKRWTNIRMWQSKAFWLLAWCCMLGETIMGICMMLLAFSPSQLSGHALFALTIAVVSLHVHIIVFICLWFEELDILNWNIICMAVSLQCCLTSATVGDGHRVEFWYPDYAWLTLTALVFVLYPATLYIGKCFVFEFSLAYFMPLFFGKSYCVLPKSVRYKFPRTVHGNITLRTYEWDESQDEKTGRSGEHWEWRGGETVMTYEELLRSWQTESSLSVLSIAQLLDCDRDRTHHQAVKVDAADLEEWAVQWMLWNTFAIDCDWLCSTHCASHTDPWQYQSNCTLPKHFFESLVRNVFGRSAVYVRVEPSEYTQHLPWFPTSRVQSIECK